LNYAPSTDPPTSDSQYSISIFHGDKLGYLQHSSFHFGSDFEKVKNETNLNNRIIECKYDPNWPHHWRFSRFRDDKETANFITVYKKVYFFFMLTIE
jgi:mRNA guanylyltransferase